MKNIELQVPTFLGNYIGGQFKKPLDPSGEWSALCPADLTHQFGKISYSYADIDLAVQEASSAFKAWKKTSSQDRMAFLKRYQDALKKNEKNIVDCIALETGKPLWEVKTEHSAMVQKIEITLSDSYKLIEPKQIQNIMEGVTGGIYYQPLGVAAVIGPFNFPGHLPNGHIIPALLSGNTVIFKPSEKTPLTGQIMAQCFHEAGFPKGVFNLLQGEKEVSRRLSAHEGIHAVLFTGSYETGVRIKQETLTQHWKLLALEMGGKNAAIVCEDAQSEVAIREIVFGAFVSAGQRCSATSRVYIHESLMDSFTERFHKIAKTLKIGHPALEPFMGPLIDASSVDRYAKFQGMALREGYEVVMRGKSLDSKPAGFFVTPSIFRAKPGTGGAEFTKKSLLQQTELFAPAVVLVPFSSLEEAITMMNATQYGLTGSVFTQDRKIFEQVLTEAEVGCLNWNRATVGASSRLPFGGLKKSGNHFPTALLSTLYCTSPLSTLECEKPTPAYSSTPGVNWD